MKLERGAFSSKCFVEPNDSPLVVAGRTLAGVEFESTIPTRHGMEMYDCWLHFVNDGLVYHGEVNTDVIVILGENNLL